MLRFILLACLLGALPLNAFAEWERLKPLPGDSLEEGRQKCRSLAEESQKKNLSLLLIGFEGQDGFKAENTRLVYRYLWLKQAGADISPPKLDNLAPVLHRLLLPLIDHFEARIEILHFPETSVNKKSGGVPEACVKEWLSTIRNAKVVFFGHSFGADAAHDLSLRLKAQQILVSQAYSIDAVARSPAKRYEKPENVGLWVNFFQRNEPPFGSYMRRGEENYDLSRYGVNHRTIVRSAPVIGTIKQRLYLDATN